MQPGRNLPIFWKGRRSPATPRLCEHPAPVLVREAQEGHVGQCLTCGAEGPVRESSQEALKVLREEGRGEEVAF